MKYVRDRCPLKEMNGRRGGVNHPTRSEDDSVNGHLEGHYPAYNMVTYERKKYLIN